MLQESRLADTINQESADAAILERVEKEGIKQDFATFASISKKFANKK
jgi:hypothetical protein